MAIIHLPILKWWHNGEKDMRLRQFQRISSKINLKTRKISCSRHLPQQLSRIIGEGGSKMEMVTLIVSTTIDPASLNPASALLSMPGWCPTQSFQGIKSFANRDSRLLQHENVIVEEDNLDIRWEAATGEVVDNVIFLSKHTAASGVPALTIHPIGVPHLRDDELPLHGGKPGWVAPPNPRMGEWLRLLKRIATTRNLIPEFEVTLEATHHGPLTKKPTMFVEIGSTSDYWERQDAADAIAQLLWEGLGLGGAPALGKWIGAVGNNKVLLGLGGGHYVPRHMDVVMKEGVWVGHLLSGYSLPMEQGQQDDESSTTSSQVVVGGRWREAIQVAFDSTKSAFPGATVLAHLDHKSLKGWQKSAMLKFLEEQKITVGKPNDFF